MNAVEGLVIEPDPAASLAAMRAWRDASAGVTMFGRPLGEWQADSRAALGLPADLPIVLTGHQAAIWHAGILAKWILTDALARAGRAAAATIVVEQDENDGGEIAFPAVRDGLIRRAALPTLPSRRGGPTGLSRAVRVGPAEEEPVAAIAAPLGAIAAAMNARAGAANLAEQVSAANDELLRRRLGVDPPPSIMAGRLLDLPFARALIAGWSADPRARVAYAEALAIDPRAARPLAPDELPVWRLRPGNPFGRREAVRTADALEPGLRLAPRAFLMTAIARLVLADVFVHGTGGARYERVTEAWIRGWLGVGLAPMAVASATIHLPIGPAPGAEPIVTRAELRRRAFDPEAPGAGPSDSRKAFLAAIEAAPRRSAARRAAYRALVADRERRRSGIAPELARLAAEVERSRDRAASVEVARSRTWPWPLHDDAPLAALATSIRLAVGR